MAERQANVLILGAGLAGLGAGHRLQQQGHQALLIEKNAYVGGHATTFRIGDFCFDEGPHVSFTQDETIKALLTEACAGDVLEYESRLTNYWQGHWIRHPAQTNLYGLPQDLIDRVIRDFDAAQSEVRPLRNYYDWCIASFGKTFADTFTAAYTRKYWTVEPAAMAPDWIGKRLHRPTREELWEGAHAPNARKQHYISYFRYPREGGFVRLSEHLAKGLDIQHGRKAVAIDPRQKTVRLENGELITYQHLISTLPMRGLLDLLPDVPAAIRAAQQDLLVTSVVLVSLGVKRATDRPDFHWAYVYDEDLLPVRISAPHTLAPHMAPPDCFSLQGEIYFSSQKPLPKLDITAQCLADFRKMGLLRPNDQPLFVDTRVLENANVVSTHAREGAVKTVKEYLQACGIASCGRYGDWGLHWSDQSILSGYREADAILAAKE